MKIILAAILTLSPHVKEDVARKYAQVIHSMCKSQEIDPLLVVSIIRVESGFHPSKSSRTNDHGLMQIHVSHTTFSELRGHEHLLRSPTLNIYLGIKHLRMFRKWHHRKCKPDHTWWRHYKWGFRRKFPNQKWADKVRRYHQQLIKKFRESQWKKVGANLIPTACQDWESSSEKSSYRFSGDWPTPLIA